MNVLTDEENAMSTNIKEQPFVWCKEEADLIIALRPYMSADDEGLPVVELLRLLADRIEEDTV